MTGKEVRALKVGDRVAVTGVDRDDPKPKRFMIESIRQVHLVTVGDQYLGNGRQYPGAYIAGGGTNEILVASDEYIIASGFPQVKVIP